MRGSVRNESKPWNGNTARPRRLGAVLALLLPLPSTACATTPPSLLAFPGPRDKSGVRVEVTSIIGTWTRPLGLAGTIENRTRETVPYVYLRLEGLGYQASTVGRASTEVLDLGPGEKRRFRAHFSLPTPRGLQQVAIGELRIRSRQENATP